MNPIVPYLNFDGNCREALKFYKHCFNGEIVMMQTWADAPDAMGMDEAVQNNIMHAEFKAGHVNFMASDAMPGHPITPGDTITLSIQFNDVGELENLFSHLASGGEVLMPVQDTFWGDKFGRLTDKYGINWMMHCPL